MSERLKKTGPLAISVGLVAFLWSEFTLNFNLHWFTVADGIFGKFGLPEKFQLVLSASFVTWGLYFALGANRAALRRTLIACTTGTIGAIVIMTLGPSLAGLPNFWGVALAIALVGAGLELLSTLSDELAAAPAFVCAASVLFWWFVTGLDNYVPGGSGPHTLAALGIGPDQASLGRRHGRAGRTALDAVAVGRAQLVRLVALRTGARRHRTRTGGGSRPDQHSLRGAGGPRVTA